MVGIMMNLKNYVEKHGKEIKIIFVMIGLKRKIKEDIAFVMKTKTHIWNVLLSRRLFDYRECCIQSKVEKI